jgi:spore coat protein A
MGMQKVKKGWFVQLVLLAIIGLTPSVVMAATATVQPSMDTSIYQGTDPVTGVVFENNSCGAGPLFSGVTADGFLRRALLKFPISQDEGGPVPPGSVINSLTLTINVERAGAANPVVMTLHPISQQWNAGVEDCTAIRGGGQGVPASPGDATWLDARFQQTPWGNAGGDFGPASASASIPTRGEGAWTASGPTDPMVLDVQNWQDNPASNFGWIVVGAETITPSTYRFTHSEGGTGPTLLIDYTPSGDTFACCFDTGSCNEFLVGDEGSCSGVGGSVSADASCNPNNCPQPIGACCNADESCSDLVSRSECEAGGGFFNGDGSSCSDNNVNCGLEPFVDPLPIPGVLQPVGSANGVDQYEVTMDEISQQLHRDLPDTDLYGYNGLYPGPTIEARVDQPIEVKYINNLGDTHMFNVDECPHGPNYWQDTARTVPHLHGGHVPSRFDGQPEYDFMPGEFDVYQYPNFNQLPATLWYHDHALGITRLNVYAGLAAYYLLRDDFELNLGLPDGEFEVPLVVQDRTFAEDGSLFYPPNLVDSFFGDKVLVNGKVWPYLNVKQGQYRFRILNGSQARQYKLRLENLADPTQVIPFQLIGTDGGLITGPITLNDFVMASAERFDVVVDFSGFAPGAEIVLKNDQPATPTLPNVMKFIVTGETGFNNALPATLRPVISIAESEATNTRRFLLEKIDEPCSGQEWVVRSLDADRNVIGEHWDDITEFPTIESTEIWEFENPTNVMHPMHVHLVMFQVLERIRLSDDASLPLMAWETGTWKDTVQAKPGTLTRVIMKFEDYLGKFAYHCHILDHEDHEMMRQFQVTNDPANCDLDDICEPGEDCISCGDCGAVSGALCGNGLCEIGDGENFDNCSLDCAGKEKGNGAFACGNPAGGDYVDCSDPRCTDNYFCRTMERVPACCGDSLCEGQETAANCANDCAGAPGGGCADISNRDECNTDPSCTWEGGKNSGQCVDEPTGCTPTGAEGPFGDSTCSDGLDNDCNGLTDADDPECQDVTMACPDYPDKNTCNAESTCKWNNKRGCETR